MVMNDNDSSWVSVRIREAIDTIENEYMRPSVVFRARVNKLSEGRYCAFIRDVRFDEKIGLTASEFNTVGSTPDEAMRNFDKLWTEKPKSNLK